ncbi:molybdate ABC transporter, permease protein [Anoxybacillus sp. B7M1]|jgi:molybdate transport system permease protein|uniref:Molybdenum transport system permease n=1 Tax=Anoxybacteroides rupiense TaxID=311460 RepID=A0ABD5ISW7_9BACL|nr:MULTISPECIES: molybdate ABC transporter permease subunit [Anoxybacillus]ANB58569.1 molybdate ABC transporter, permease protein [Anoxybacillus sp. B2M1]ANB63521.1 molybdate ABC transporter, permease protein [Anoxybacillus sp. B7M1]KXG08949.1 Molybdenum transport system permease protein ModB [Anoxybacillus sp. P3H1B]MBB3908152.1 molybdate transport system permease protein [Anoxybacillus rupiensis]MDE8565447.1 molybdate ABC transporter permease subunit [Anoxybacillus rupiensis]
MNYSPLILSLKTATIATLIVFITGVVLARLISRSSFKGKSMIEAVILLPLVLPPTVVGFGLLYVFGKNGFIGRLLLDWFDFQIVFTWYGVVIAAVVVSFPLMYQSAAAAFQQYDQNIENAAYTMGASKWRVFWTISFPLAWPGLLSGFVLSFARALGEFGATLMIAGYIPNVTDTIPLAIYFAVESGNMEAAKFWVIMIVCLGFSAILWLNWWSKKNMMKHIHK